MNTKINILLQAELDKLVLELKQKHIELGMKASGQWLETTKAGTELNDDTIIGYIISQDYSEYLVNGRPPSEKFPPIEAIKEWILDKGIPYDNLNSTAFLIARKIKESGTNYYIQGGTDLIDGVITEMCHDLLERTVKHYFHNLFLLSSCA